MNTNLRDYTPLNVIESYIAVIRVLAGKSDKDYRDEIIVAADAALAIIEGRSAPTPRQQQLLEFMINYHDRQNIMPTFNEMAAGIGISSKSGVYQLLQGLEYRGLIRRGRYGSWRAVRLLMA